MTAQTATLKRRRGRDEGGIRQRTDGRWEATMSLGGGKRKSWYGRTRAEVRDKLTAALRDRERGILPSSDERQTVAQYLASWLDTIAPSLSSGTVRRSRDDVRLHILPALGHVRLTQLTPQHVQALYAAKLTTGLSTTTVRHLHGTLHKALADALRLGLVARNVTEAVTPPRRRSVEMHPLTGEETRAFLEAVRRDRLSALYALAVLTGMRQGELLGLHWSAVDLDAGTLQVTANLQWDRDEAKFDVHAPKTRRSRRRIALSAELVTVLREHRRRQHEERLLVGPAWHKDDLIFCTQTGKPLFARNVTRSFHAHLRRAGLPAIRFHDLRHTCATLLLRSGVNVKVVSEMLGHASTSLTLDVYAHVTPDMQQAAAAVMGKLVYGG